MIADLPRWPNDLASKIFVEERGINELAIYYVCWKARYIPARPRRVSVDPAVVYDYRFSGHDLGLKLLLARAAKGANLTPHLSLKAHQRGVTPVRRGLQTPNDKWADKDFALTILGWHHFHLGMTNEKRGHAARSGPVLFAEVTRDTFEAVTLSDHSAFELGSPESLRLLELSGYRLSRRHPPGTLFMRNPVMTSGHPVQQVMYADHCLGIMHANETQVDTLAFRQAFYDAAKMPVPKCPHLVWRFAGLDFGIYDPEHNIFASYVTGWL